MVLKLLEIIKIGVKEKNNQTAFIFWFLILITSFAFQAYGFGFNRILPRNLIENSATLIVIVSFSLLFNSKWRNILQYVGYLVFWLNNLFECMYYYLFNANISASSIFILLETNLAEAREFFEFYFNPFLLIVAIVFLIQLVLFFKYRPVFRIESKIKYQKWIYGLGIIIPIYLIIFRGYQQYNFIYLSVDAVVEYIEEQQKMREFEIDKPLADIKGFSIEKQIDTATYVLVIGESTTRRRMSVYDYNRKTTPFLDSLKPDLWLYNNVISSHAYTIGALRNALVINGLKSKEDFSIIQMMNEAGFKTYWISNQRPIGQYESLVTQIAMSSDVYLTKNTAFDGSITPYDDVLLSEFKKALTDPEPKKFIVLHPLGTHLLYEDRYPKEFEVFKGQSNIKYKHDQAVQRSNSYDNAVLYHDNFLKEVFKNLKNIQHKSYMFYFSDHGDEVYESIDFSGHAEENPTKSMYEIPFFIWMNDEFQLSFEKEYIPENAYPLQYFIHTLSDLNGFDFEEFDVNKSIFTKQNMNAKRKLGNDKYYNDLP
jgi:heptose-I-phosphate ethanolaminephosphotransferase